MLLPYDMVREYNIDLYETILEGNQKNVEKFQESIL